MAASDVERWSLALAQYGRELERRGIAASTRARLTKQVRRFAGEAAGHPFDVDHDLVADWLASLDCSTAVLYGYRSALRSFYRWAYEAGRIDADPTETIGGWARASMPRAWQRPVADFKRHLYAAGRAKATVALRLQCLGVIARGLPHADPWAADLGDLVEFIAGHDWAPERARSYRATLRQFYQWAEDTGRVDVSPAAGLPVIRVRQPVARPAGEGAYELALAKAAPRERLMLRLAAELGLRRAEVASIHASDLTHDGACFWLLVHGKGAKERLVPVPAELAGVMRRTFHVSGEWLFLGRTGHLTAQHVGKVVARLLPPGVPMHTLRHRFASRAYAAGGHDLLAVQQLLGHSSAQTTQRYVQLPAGSLLQVVEGVAAGAAGRRPATLPS